MEREPSISARGAAYCQNLHQQVKTCKYSYFYSNIFIQILDYIAISILSLLPRSPSASEDPPLIKKKYYRSKVIVNDHPFIQIVQNTELTIFM